MTKRFIVQPSKMILRWLFSLHAAAIIVITLFAISSYIKWMLIFLVLISCWWQFKQWKANKLFLEFNALNQQWVLSKDEIQWEEMIKVRPIYVTNKFIWLNFFGQLGSLVTVIIGADSMNEAKYLQLRRSVICPAALIRSSFYAR